MLQRQNRLRLLTLFSVSGLLLASEKGFASGFALFEQNGTGVGDFDSGGAAEAADASTAWYNPAGLVRLKQQELVVGAVGVNADIKFHGDVQNYSQTQVGPFTFNLLGSDEWGSAQGGGQLAVPFFHYAFPINDNFVAALSIVVPFGLQTDFPEDSVVRYSTTLTGITDIDITPSLGIKITDKFSVGAGVDFQHVDAVFNQVVGVGDLSPTPTDTTSHNEATDWALGWHAGLLYQFTPHTRVGFAYHSKLKVDAHGTSKLKGPLVDIATGGASNEYTWNDANSNIVLPAVASLSFFHDINERWAIKGTANYTAWQVFDDTPLDDVAGVEQGGPNGFTPVLIDVDVPQHFHNTWRIALGVNYKPTDKWMLRAGMGVDQDPTNITDRNLRMPDSDRFNVAIGAHYQATKSVGLDLGWTHLFVQDSIINNQGVAGQQTTYVNGIVQSSGDLLGLQLTWKI